MAFAVGEVPDEGAEEVDEAFEDADHQDPHQDPFPHLGGERAFDDTSEAETQRSDNGCSNNSHPDGHAFDKLLFIHNQLY